MAPNLRLIRAMRAAERLKSNKRQIIQQWEKAVRQEVPAAAQLEHPVLLDALPLYLDYLVEVLSTPETSGPVETLSKEHGAIRARISPYSLDQLIFEIQALRRTILRVLEKDEPLKPPERDLLLDEMDRTARESAKGFMDEYGVLREIGISELVHDLRNPLAAARSNVELILRFAGHEEKQKQRARKAVELIDKSDRMLRDLLDANRVRAGERLPLRLGDCELRELILGIVSDATAVYGERFVTNLAEVRGYWDCHALSRAIQNLISNAVKYGDPSLPITISNGIADGIVHFEVHNHGNPISKEEQERLFERHRRSRSAQRSGKAGWGLGLPVVKGIVEAHGGSVTVTSSPETGTRFVVSVPRDARTAQVVRHNLSS